MKQAARHTGVTGLTAMYIITILFELGKELGKTNQRGRQAWGGGGRGEEEEEAKGKVYIEVGGGWKEVEEEEEEEGSVTQKL